MKYIGDWVAKRAMESEEVAFHYLRFAGDTYPIGTPDVLQAIRSVSNDKRKVIQKAVQQALCNAA